MKKYCFRLLCKFINHLEQIGDIRARVHKLYNNRGKKMLLEDIMMYISFFIPILQIRYLVLSGNNDVYVSCAAISTSIIMAFIFCVLLKALKEFVFADNGLEPCMYAVIWTFYFCFEVSVFFAYLMTSYLIYNTFVKRFEVI